MVKGADVCLGSSSCLEGVENALQHWSIPHDPNDDDVDADGDETGNITLGGLKLWRTRHRPSKGVRLLKVSARMHRLQLYSARWSGHLMNSREP